MELLIIICNHWFRRSDPTNHSPSIHLIVHLLQNISRSESFGDLKTLMNVDTLSITHTNHLKYYQLLKWKGSKAQAISGCSRKTKCGKTN